MLTVNQIKALAHVGDLKLKFCNDIPIAVARVRDKTIKYPYDKFKKLMGLDSLRLDWLLGKDNFIAGGAVLNWIWGEQTNEDIDFFFKQEESVQMFQLFIENIGFEEVYSSGYARTFFEPTAGVILQVVGRPGEPMSKDYVAYGDPHLVINNFDIHACKFAIDSEFLYTTSRAIQDLFKLQLDLTGAQKRNPGLILKRVLKYNRKGFFPSSTVKQALTVDTASLPTVTSIPIYEIINW